MFWCRLGEMLVLSGNDYRLFNDTTQDLAELWAGHVNDTLYVRYLWLFDPDHRLAKRIAMELESNESPAE